MRESRHLVLLVAGVFFLSGSSALVFENLWFRVAGIVLGSSIWSATSVLMAFMAGLGLGNGLMAVYGDRVGNPLKAYIITELVIGFTGVIAIFILPIASPLIAIYLPISDGHAGLLNFVRFGTAFMAFLLPSIAMGMTIPLLQKYLVGQQRSFSKSLGMLYGFNTLGAVCGTLAAEFLLIKAFGVQGSGFFACAINLLIVLILLRLNSQEPSTSHSVNVATRSWHVRQVDMTLLPPFLSGFILLALEVVWFRYLLLAHSGTSEVFALLLGIVLAGIALGGLLASRFSLNGPRLQQYMLYLPLLAAIVLALSFLLFSNIIERYFAQLDASLSAFTLAAIVLMLPSAIISGCLFPIFGEDLFRRLEHTSKATGVLTLSNTVGAALGSGTATFILLPALGIESTLLLLVMLYILISIIVAAITPASELVTRRTSNVYLPVGLAAIIALLCFPFAALDNFYQTFAKLKLPNYERVAIKEGLNETLQYYQTEFVGEPLNMRLITNNFSMSGISYVANRYMKLYAYFPYVFNPQIKSVLQISYGVGNTAEAIAQIDSMENFDIVDISEDIFSMSKYVQKVSEKSPLEDLRTHVHIEDGRFFLQTTQKFYDLITAEPPPPKNAGVVNLYTEEYFSLIYRRLNHKGMVTYWLPAHDLHDSDSMAIIKSFCLVFEDCSLWSAAGLEFMLVGSKGGLNKVSTSQLEQVWQSHPGVGLRNIGFDSPAALLTTFVADGDFLRALTEDTEPVTDNYPQRISPNQAGMTSFSPIYAALLSGERRQMALGESQYIRRLFPDDIITEAVGRYFRENLLTGSFSPLYRDRNLYYWESLSTVLVNTSLTTEPLLMLRGDPRKEQRLRDTEAAAEPIKNKAYHLAYMKHLIILRQYQQAAEYFEQNLRHYGYSIKQAVFLQQLYFLSLALAGNLSAKEMQQIAPLANPSMEPAYVNWFLQRFP